MAKVMLVEDDNNLREIYEARLLAEGYEIVSAKDGEEALAQAVKEKPDLIIADIMMPKISGFDMLDILRSTPETKYTKVIMMTALSQAEDKARAEKLGADRYLVKSQVTLEDVAKVAREVLEGPATTVLATPETNPTSSPTPDPQPTDSAALPATEASQAPSTNVSAIPTDIPVEAAPAAAPAPTPITVQDAPSTDTTAQRAPSTAPPPSATAQDSNDAVLADAVATINGNGPAATPAPAAEPGATVQAHDATMIGGPSDNAGGSDEGATTASSDDQPGTSVHTKVISPINDVTTPGVDLNALLEKEQVKDTTHSEAGLPTAPLMAPGTSITPTTDGVASSSPSSSSSDPNAIAL
jgi:CheY-like chemotaxis protein